VALAAIMEIELSIPNHLKKMLLDMDEFMISTFEQKLQDQPSKSPLKAGTVHGRLVAHQQEMRITSLEMQSG
jgi:hypothetical protein